MIECFYWTAHADALDAATHAALLQNGNAVLSPANSEDLIRKIAVA